MSVPNYATKYIGKNNAILDFHNIQQFIENIKDIDKKIEDMTIECKNINANIDINSNHQTPNNTLIFQWKMTHRKRNFRRKKIFSA